MSSDNPTVPYGYCQCGCGQETNIAAATNPRYGHVKGQPFRFRTGHCHRGRKYKPLRYIEEDRGYETPCWIWQLWIMPATGYGWDGRYGLAHRVSYEERYGPIPAGLVIDHLCRVRACVNPEHLEPVLQVENVRRGTNTKLTAAEVSEIKALPMLTTVALGTRYGVSRQTISSIRSGRVWRSVA